MKEMILKFWKKWFGEKKEVIIQTSPSECVSHTPSPSQEGKKSAKLSSLLEDLEAYLFGKYEFRFNVLQER